MTYADRQSEDHSIREMTLDEVLISSHSETSSDVIGGDVILPKNTPPNPSSYNSNADSSSSKVEGEKKKMMRGENSSQMPSSWPWKARIQTPGMGGCCGFRKRPFSY